MADELVVSPSGPVFHDWPVLWKQYQGSGIQQKLWAEKNSLSETLVSREFAKIRRERAERQIEKAKLILAGQAPVAARTLNARLHSDDEKISLKASVALLGAVGISPQMAAIQVNNSTNIQILATPIFASEGAPVLNGFLSNRDDNIADDTPDS